jgi:hypothetical protein
MNHRLGEKGMNMVGSHMDMVEGIDTMDEHFHPMNHRSEVESMDTVEEHFHPMNHRSEVDSGMRENRTTEFEVVERKPECMVLVRHWTDDGAARHR